MLVIDVAIWYSLRVSQTRLLAPLLVLFLLCSSALAQKPRHWFVSGSVGQSIIVLGSQDLRQGGGIGVGYEFGYARRLRWGRARGSFVMEGYYDLTKSEGVKNFPPDSTQAWGILAASRYRWKNEGAPTGFLDIGWGLQYSGLVTRDLSSKLNSTPFFDLGIEVGHDHPEAQVGLRILHVSNAGIVKNNKGQNELFLLIQVPL